MSSITSTTLINHVISGPVCVRKLTAAMAANEKKFFIVHDEHQNSSIARLQTTSLATALGAAGITAYYRNGPIASDLNLHGDEETYRRSWLGNDKTDIDRSIGFIRNTCDRKGPYYGILTLGRISSLGRAIALDHGIETQIATPVDETCTYPIHFLTSLAAFSLSVPSGPNEAAELQLPVDMLVNGVKAALSASAKIYSFPKPTLAECKEAKWAKKHAQGKEAIRLAEQKYRHVWIAATQQHYPYNPNNETVSTSNEAVSNYVSQPTAEPVTPCPLAALEPMIHWLEQNQNGILPQAEPRVDFVKGSILGKTTVGGGTSVDLCKQVVGPVGIGPVLDAVAKNGGIDRFLLGNNIVGDEGAEVIANFMKKDEADKVYCFYIAGNSITSAGIRSISHSLVNNTRVTALWLKRNPLGPEGAMYLAEMLEHNTTLQVLDLVGTNVQDTGAEYVFAALSRNPNSALEHLYFGSSNHGVPTAKAAAEYLKTGHSKLKSLFVAMSRLGDEGAIALAEGIKCDSKLERLGLSSCLIGDVGVKALADAFEGKRNLVSLDLGWRRGTLELGEKGNVFGDEGALYLGEKLMMSGCGVADLDLTNTAMTHNGVGQFVNAYVVGNPNVQAIKLKQRHGVGALRRNVGAERLAKEVCIANRLRLEERDGDEAKRIREALNPTHVKHIYSVYRGNM